MNTNTVLAVWVWKLVIQGTSNNPKTLDGFEDWWGHPIVLQLEKFSNLVRILPFVFHNFIYYFSLKFAFIFVCLLSNVLSIFPVAKSAYSHFLHLMRTPSLHRFFAFFVSYLLIVRLETPLSRWVCATPWQILYINYCVLLTYHLSVIISMRVFGLRWIAIYQIGHFLRDKRLALVFRIFSFVLYFIADNLYRILDVLKKFIIIDSRLPSSRKKQYCKARCEQVTIMLVIKPIGFGLSHRGICLFCRVCS